MKAVATCAAADIGTIPLFVKTGSIIPMGCEAQSTAESKLERLVIYPGADASFVLYEDGNDGYGYENGECSFTTFTWNDRDQSLTVNERKGKFPSMEESREIEVVIECENHASVHHKLQLNGKQRVIKR